MPAALYLLELVAQQSHPGSSYVQPTILDIQSYEYGNEPQLARAVHHTRPCSVNWKRKPWHIRRMYQHAYIWRMCFPGY